MQCPRSTQVAECSMVMAAYCHDTHQGTDTVSGGTLDL